MIDTHARIYRHLDSVLASTVVGISSAAAAFVLTGTPAFALPALVIAGVVARYGKRAYLGVFECPACQMEIETGKTCPQCAEMGLVTPVEHARLEDVDEGEEKETDGEDAEGGPDFRPTIYCALHGMMRPGMANPGLDTRFKEWKARNPSCRLQIEHAGQILLVDK